MSAPPPYPIIVGVTGHRDIAPGKENDVRSALQVVLTELHAQFGDALYLMTALADGADQLVADVAENFVRRDGTKASLKIIAVSPMPLATYREKVWDKEKLTHHWDRAALKLDLPDLNGSAVAGYDEQQYEQLGALLSRRSHLLLALWDGLPPSPRGGTASVVRMRLEDEHDVAGFRDSPLFAGAVSRLDLSPGGPVLQVVTPRTATGGAVVVTGQPNVKAGDCFLLQSVNDGAGVNPVPVDPGNVVAALNDQMRQDFAQITRLNRQIARFRGPDNRLFADQLRYLTAANVANPERESSAHLDQLRQWQAAADTAAQYFQRRLLGQFVPARSMREVLANGWKTLRQLRRPPRIGVLFGFAAAVPAAVLLFVIYAHLGRSPWALGLYLAVFAGSAALYHFHVRRHELQNRFQDYRALAEAMRVQLFWALAATPVAVSDNYLRLQSGELGWIQFALRGPALWASALALELKTPKRDLVTKGWIEDQLDFFGRPGAASGKTILHEHAAQRGRLWARRFLFGGLGVSAILAVIEALKLAFGVHGQHPDGVWHVVAEAQEWLLVLAATAPAVAAFFTVSVDLRAYDAHAHSYALMGRIFERAREVAAGATDQEFQALVRELGREALAENAEWLLDHRRRPIEHQ
jgi:hypothetical protein